MNARWRICALALTAVAVAFGGDFYVEDVKVNPAAADTPAEGRGTEALPYATIQAAVDAAGADNSPYSFDAGDAIRVKEGLYDYGGYVDENGYTNRVYITKKVRIVATGRRERTVLEGRHDPTTGGHGAGAVQGVLIANTTAAEGGIFRGFTVRNCCTHTAGQNGGAFCSSGEHADALYVADCIVTNNSANRAGGFNGCTGVRCFLSKNNNIGGTLGKESMYGAFAHCIFYGTGSGNSDLTRGVRMLHCTVWDEDGGIDGTVYNSLVLRSDGTSSGSGTAYATVTAATGGATACEVLSPATRDFRLATGAVSIGAASFDHLSQVTYPAELGNTDYYGNPLPTEGSLNCGASQEVVSPATGVFKVTALCSVDGYATMRATSFARSATAPKQFVIAPPKGETFLHGYSGNSTSLHRHPWCDGCFHEMAPEVGSTTTLDIEKTLNVFWVDDKNGSDLNDGTSEAKAFKTLACAATNATKSSCVIWVKPGVYDDGVNGTARISLTAGNNHAKTSLRSTDGPEKTVIVGGTNIRCLSSGYYGGATGFTFTGYNGSGTCCDMSQDQTYYQDCIFSNNTANILATMYAQRCKFIDNKVSNCLIQGFAAHGCLFYGNNCGSGSLVSRPSWSQAKFQLHNCTAVNNTTTGAALLDAVNAYNTVVVGCKALGSNFGGGNGCWFWNLTSSANVPAVATIGDPMLTDPDNGDCRPFGTSPLLGGGTVYNELAVLNDAGYRRLASGGVDSGWFAFTGSPARHTVGAYQASATIGARIAAGEGGFAVEGANTGLNLIEAGETLSFTITRTEDGPHYCQGLTVNGTYVDLDDYPDGWSHTVSDAASSVAVEPVYSYNWYVSPTGSDSANGFTTNTPFKTIAHAFTKAVKGDTVWALPGTYGSDEPASAHLSGATVYSRVVVPNGLTLAAYDPDPSKTVIEGAAKTDTTPAIRCATVFANATIRGFTLRGGRCNSSASSEGDKYGGGVFGSGTTLGASGYQGMAEDCILTGCSGGRGGGAANTYLRRCRITGCNNACYYCYVANSVFSANSASFASAWCCTTVNCTFAAGECTPFWTPTAIRNCLVLTACGGTTVNGKNSYCVFVTDKSTKPAASDLGTGSIITNAAALKLDANGCPTAESVLLIDKGTSTGYDTTWCGDTDSAGGQRIYNGAIDIGHCEYDWRPTYAADLKSGLDVASATKDVTETAAKGLTVSNGGSIVLTAASAPRKRIFPFAVTDGTLTVTLNGEEVAAFTADGSWAYANGAAGDVLAFSFAGTGSATLKRTCSAGCVFIIR